MLDWKDKYLNKIVNINCPEGLKELPGESVDCIITSPPYWGLRDYSLPPMIWDAVDGCQHEWVDHVRKPQGGRGSKCANVGANKNDIANLRDHDTITNFCSLCGAWRGSLGLEPTFQLYIQHLMQIFKEVKRVLKPTGTCWVNMGDTYATHTGKRSPQFNTDINSDINSIFTKNRQRQSVSEKSLCLIPERFIIMMVDELGFIARNKIVWYKRNCMPSSAKDRFTVDWEPVFFFTKQKKYWFEQQFEEHGAIGKPRQIGAKGRNKRCVNICNIQYMRLRKDLTFATKQRILQEMLKRGLI